MKNFIQNTLLFVVTAAAGFAAMSLPFRLFDELSQIEMRLVLAAEVAALAIIFSAVFLTKEAREQKKRRNARATERHTERVWQQKKDNSGTYQDTGFDFAA